MDLQKAIAIAGPLSYPSKMPCPSWGIDPKHCKSGSKRRKMKGTVCSTCYACKGCYNFKNVRAVQEVRLEGVSHPLWTEAIATQIRAANTTRFRWFDSGDVQSPEHLEKIYRVAELLPEVEFWMPTQEYKMVKNARKPPDNLVVRVSHPMLNPKTQLKGFACQSAVADKDGKGFKCPASWGDKHKCAENNCTACWDKQVSLITYRRH